MDPNNPIEITPELLQANPALALSLTVFSLFLCAGLVGVLVSWGFVGYSLWKHKPLLKAQPWHARPWGLADLVLTGFLVIATQILLTSLAIPMLDIDVRALRADDQVPMSLAAVVSAGYLLTALLATGWIVFRYRESSSVLGWSTYRLPKKLLIGLVTGLAVLPFVLVLSAVVSITTETEYEHPILEAMKNEGTLTSYLLALFSAVIVAPVAEEFLFRVLIQGWLQSIPYVRPLAALLGRTGQSFEAGVDVREEPGSGEPRHSPRVPDDGNYHVVADVAALPPRVTDVVVQDAAGDARSVAEPPPAPIWPSLVTGVLFGLAHWEYGLSFVPLIVLGVILGLLYRATTSIWPCIMLHFMLNASSMFALGIGVYLEKVAGNN